MHAGLHPRSAPPPVDIPPAYRLDGDPQSGGTPPPPPPPPPVGDDGDERDGD